jgi:hypothetical protein
MYRGTNGCMYNCGDICTRECMKPMQEITDYKIKPKFDEEGNILSYDIIAQLKKWGLKIEERELSVVERMEYYGKHFMNNETTIKLQQELIDLYEQQIMDLTMMSKIELGDDVIEEIKRLKTLINEQK